MESMGTDPSGVRTRKRRRDDLPPLSRVLRDALAAAWHIQVHHGGVLTHLPQDVSKPLVAAGYLTQVEARRYRVSLLGMEYLRETGGVHCDERCRDELR